MGARDPDVLIVGGGSAGSVLAARLSEDPACRVCLIEAGPESFSAEDLAPGTPFSDDVRALFWTDAAFAGFAKHGWSYHGFAFAGERHPLAVVRGRVLGGSSATNGSAWLRGTPESYAAWGSPLWTYEELLPGFRRSETDLFGDRDFHGDGGPIPVERVPLTSWWPFHRAAMEGARELGYDEKPDMNHPEGSGFGSIPRNMVDGVRVTAAAGYLEPAEERSNLEIRCDAQVARIVVEAGRAIGVELRKRPGELLPAGEVVVCAGAIESPHLLMLSGIGPAPALREAGIEVLVDLPGVGENLRDHPIVSIAADVTGRGGKAADGMSFPNVLHYTAPGSTVVNDLQLMPSYPVPCGAGGRDAVSIDIGLQQPLSAGRIVLDAADPAAAPRIHFDYLEHAEDRRRLISVLRFGDRLLDSDACRELEVRRISPGERDYEDDTALESWLEANLASAFHAAGTCRIGPTSDPLAVVDERCRVHGIESLRIADMSIAPLSISNAAATAVAIGERTAELFVE
jgi:choline dehydrogenase